MLEIGESGQFELVPERINSDRTITRAGDEVFVRGIGNRLLGIGTYAGELVLEEASGNQVSYPILQIQGELVSGGQVDKWSTDPKLIETHRDETVFPISHYLDVLRAKDAEFTRLMDEALASEMGVDLG
jgi:hypothetical protein